MNQYSRYHNQCHRVALFLLVVTLLNHMELFSTSSWESIESKIFFITQILKEIQFEPLKLIRNELCSHQ